MSGTDTSAGPFPEQNLAAFLLTVGGVTVAFIAVFVFTIGDAVGNIFIWTAIGVGLITVFVGMTLDLLGFFDSERAVLRDRTESSGQVDAIEFAADPTVSPLLDFEAELQTIADAFGESPPSQLTTFVEEYRRIRDKGVSSRADAAGDLRASLNPLSVIAEGEEVLEDAVAQIEQKLQLYVSSAPYELFEIEEVGLYVDGSRTAVQDVAGQQARIKLEVHNAGDTAKAEVRLRFRSAEGVVVRREFLPMGEIAADATKQLDTQVYVPSVAARMQVESVRPSDDTPVLDL
jgi:hypothetical protein